MLFIFRKRVIRVCTSITWQGLSWHPRHEVGNTHSCARSIYSAGWERPCRYYNIYLLHLLLSFISLIKYIYRILRLGLNKKSLHFMLNKTFPLGMCICRIQNATTDILSFKNGWHLLSNWIHFPVLIHRGRYRTTERRPQWARRPHSGNSQSVFEI